MGKCLSCCEPEDQPSQNGHTLSTSTPTKSTVAATQNVMPGPLQHKQEANPPQPLVADMQQYGKQGTNGDRAKMFSQYPKLPPIRKPSNSDSTKRMSFTSKEFSEIKINNLFDSYKDPEEDNILADGVERICNDLEVRPEEFKVLVLAWNFEAETMCRFTRSEFVNGCKKLRVDTIKGIQSKFPEMIAEVQNKQTFKELYRWTYKFGLDTDIGQRTLPVDMALSLWSLVYSLNEPQILKRWLAFLERHATIRGIPKDTWDMFLNFCEAVGEDLSSYDDTEAWPSLFDDFVEHENDHANQNVQLEKNECDFS